MQSAVEQIDNISRKISAEDETHVKHLSFKNNIRVERIAGLQLNRLLNGRIKCERLDNAHVMDKAKWFFKNRKSRNIIDEC